MPYSKKSKSMEFTRILLNYAGIIPKNNPYNPTRVFSMRSIFVKIGLVLLFTGALMFIIQNNVKESFLALLIVSFVPRVFLKHLSTAQNSKFVQMLEMTDQLLESVEMDEKSKEVFEMADNLGLKGSKFIMYTGSVFPILSIVMMFTNSFIFEKSLESPFQLWFPFKFSLLQLPLELIFVYCSTVTEYPYLISLLTVTNHVTSSIKILSHNLNPNLNFKTSEKINLEFHRNLIQLVNLVNINYGGILTFEITCSSIQACFSAFLIVAASKNFDGQFYMAIVTFCIVWLLPFVICLCGQRIESEGDNMFRILFQSSWYTRSPKDRKTVLLMMLMMSKPLKLHYKRFIVFNMERFAAVVQGSYSFITMMRSVLF